MRNAHGLEAGIEETCGAPPVSLHRGIDSGFVIRCRRAEHEEQGLVVILGGAGGDAVSRSGSIARSFVEALRQVHEAIKERLVGRARCVDGVDGR